MAVLNMRCGAVLRIRDRLEVLALHGLEAPAARADRLAIQELDGVIGVKGAGAALADGVVVCVRPDSGVREQVIAAALGRGLKLMEHDSGPGALSADEHS